MENEEDRVGEELTGVADAALERADIHGDGGLLGRLEVVESQPLEQRAAHYEQLHDELLAELQQSDPSA